MSERFVPLRQALENLPLRAQLILHLRAGEIAAYAAESFGSEIVEYAVTSSAEEMINRVFDGEATRRVALRRLLTQTTSLKYVFSFEIGYIAIREDIREFVAFTSHNRKREGHCSVPKTIWKFAYIDESKDVVVYDDFDGLWRKEYMQVHLDDAALRSIERKLTVSVKRGRHSLYRLEVEEFAHSIVKEGKTLKVFIREIMRQHPSAGSYGTIDRHYGDIWRRAEKARSDQARSGRPKIT